MLRILLMSVSYAAMTLPFMIEEEQKFYSSEDYLKMKKHQQKMATMAVISQTMRFGKQLAMFSRHHRIRPQVLNESEVQ